MRRQDVFKPLFMQHCMLDPEGNSEFAHRFKMVDVCSKNDWIALANENCKTSDAKWKVSEP